MSEEKNGTSAFKIPVSNNIYAPGEANLDPIIKPTPPSTPPLEETLHQSSSAFPSQQRSSTTLRRRLSMDNSQQQPHTFLVPKTPDHLNLNNGFENTPLQSPTKTPRSAKRRSADIYSLLETPDSKIQHRLSNSHHDDLENEHNDDEELARQAKRSSLQLYKLLNTEDNKVKLTSMSPVMGSSAVFNDNNNPTSPNKNAYRVKKSEADIKELSNNLKTRLNYAFLKVKHGWTEKPISELEGSALPQRASSPPKRETPISRPRPLSLHAPGTTPHFPNRIRLDEFASSRSHRRNSFNSPGTSTTNANEALFSALSPRQPSNTATLTTKQEVDPEKTAAMSLMKLSSPIKSNATISFGSNSTQSSPTKRPQAPPPYSARPVILPEDDEEDNKTETDIDDDDLVSLPAAGKDNAVF